MAVGLRYYDSSCSCGTAYAVAENKLTKGATHDETICTNQLVLRVLRSLGEGGRSAQGDPRLIPRARRLRRGILVSSLAREGRRECANVKITNIQ